jgi:cold shock CspA family protein
MKGIINWYSDKKGYGVIEGKDGRDAIIYERDIPFLLLLPPGDTVENQGNKTWRVVQGYKC